ncbi:MAG: ABC transporter permease [Chloroflexi bacterium]|nr:ABC transporter permease [Chloroflexota bacterium]MBP7593616.1 ABC transporter permease [Chloroflexota bacterium]
MKAVPDTDQTQSNGIALVIVGLTLLLWEAIVRWRAIPVYILPAPSLIGQTLVGNIGLFAEATAVTLSEALLGLLLGTTTGAGLAVLLSLWPRLERGVMTLAILVKSTPLVAIAPLLTIWLGFGMIPKIIITALLTFFPVLVNVLAGLQRADPAMLDLFHTWHSGRREIFRHVRAPSALPYLFTALKIAGPLALIAAVVAEWTGASGGLGRTMWLAYTNLNLPYLFAAIFILAFAGVMVYGGIVWLEKRVVFWQPTSQF